MKTKTDYVFILDRNKYPYHRNCHYSCCCLLFLVPSHTSISSMSGLGIVLSNFVSVKVLSAITMILNVVLLIIGFFTWGKEFGLKNSLHECYAAGCFLGYI